ncbi:TPA: hypothetical protein HA338_02505 [Methanosarcina acetivorans]|nr:NosD domain-containing protein [Methanosarcina acetivorans]HIH92940.1 hypothetical protein [Methanosarcina acetivorans]
MKIKFCYLITFIFLLIFAGTGAADTISVDDSEGADYTSIQEAIDNATSGDTILVYPGTYEENVNVNKELAIKSYSGNSDETIIRAASSKGDVFHVTANSVTINGLQITGAKTDEYGEDKTGIYLENVSKALISGNNISSNSFGVYLLDSSNNTLANNSVSMSRIGVLLWNSSNNRLNNNILNLNNHYGILLYEFSSNNELSNNTANWTYAGFGIELFFSYNNTLVNNTASNNRIGISLIETGYDYLINNSASSNDWSGINLQSSNNNSLLNNVANSNNISGIFLIDSSGNILDSNYASNNTGYGININNSSRNNILKNNIANLNGKEDLIFNDSENNTITGPREEVPFPGSELAGVSVLLTYLIFGRKVRGK